MSSRPSFFAVLSTWTYALLICGVLMLTVSVLMKTLGPQTDNLTATAPGVVSRVDMKKNSKGKRSYVTFVTFEDSDHRTYETQSANADHDGRHYVGQEVTVHYNPYHPDTRVLIEGDEDLLASWNFAGTFMLYGGIAFMLGFALLAMHDWRIATSMEE